MKSRFDDLYEKVLKITELYPKVPESMWGIVFQTLFEAAREGPEVNMFEQNVLNKSVENSLKLSDIIDLERLKSNVDKSLYFVYYLELLGITPITADYVGACYSICNYEIPENKLAQNLRDLVNKYNFLEFDGVGYSTSSKGRIACIKKNFLKETEKNTN